MVEEKSKLHLDKPLMDLKELFFCKLNESFFIWGDGVLSYQGILCIPKVDELRDKILEESHGFRYSIRVEKNVL